MKKYCIPVLFLFGAYLCYGQYEITSQGMVNACSGTFTQGSYSTGNSYTMTICSDGIGDSHISVFFTSWNVTGSLLCVYDGTNTGAPLIGCYDNSNWGSTQAMTATQANLSGCLTFVFNATAAGSSWSGDISCFFVCQLFYAVLDYTDPPGTTQYLDICQGETVTFYGEGDYYLNDNFYHQDDTTSVFIWDFNDGTMAPGQVVTHTFPNEGGYDIDLSVTDVEGCVNSNDIGFRVRVSTDPDFTGTYANPTTICIGETANLYGVVTPVEWTNLPDTVVAGTTYLPDGDGDSYFTSLTFDVFDPGQTLTDVNDLLGICANMEHSFLGDLIISITCPNGTQVIMENQAGGGTFLGVPIDVEDPNQPGTGWDYCWDPTS
ncbi:MAG: PKD domain-containing protein, partial [Bacteroidia bacterium]|nr:PKD domain-containing protein [Bacteroidia bacterium]